MATGKALDGKPYAGNPHVRFDEGEVAPAATPRRGSLLYKKLVDKGSVLLLNACYKQNDDEVLGVFDSMEALIVFFARTIVECHEKEDPAEVAELVARLTTDLLGEGENDECLDECTRYWYSELQIMGFKDDEDGKDDKDDTDDTEECD